MHRENPNNFAATVSSQIPQDPAFNRAVLGTSYIRPSNTSGEVAHLSRIGNPCNREYNVGHATPTKANTCMTTGRAEMRNGHRCNRGNGTRSANPE